MAEEIVVEPNVEVVPEVVVNEPKVATIGDDELVEIIWNGEKIKQPWKEARANIQKAEDYTRKTQHVAKQTKDLEDLFNGLTAKQRELAEKEAAIDAVLGRSSGHKPESKTPAADEVMTYGQLQAILKEHTENLGRQFSSTLQETTAKSEQERVYQRWEDRASETVSQLVKENPILKTIPQLDIVLKREAGKASPTSEQEMFQALVSSGKKLASDLEHVVTERQKEKAQRREQLSTKGPEPAGGAPVLSTKKTYGEGRKINWKEIEADVIAALDNQND